MSAQKLLTCVVPCYNSAAYMEKAVDSLLAGGEEMEILIVDDGSTDGTGAIADRLAAEHPSIIRAHHQQNAGHGSALNYGIAHAEGIYLKSVDSDDRLVKENVPGLMNVLRAHSAPGNQADLVFHDYVYDRPEQENVYQVSFQGKIEPDRLGTWEECRPFHMWNQFMIHNIIYRTQFLRDTNTRMPEHTFYEDNVYIYRPLGNTRKILYHHAPLYGYLVGRTDQSIDEKNILKRLDQATNMAKEQITSFTMAELKARPKNLRNYMINSCCGQLFTTCSLQQIDGTERGLGMYRDLWQTIRDFDPALYRRLRRNPLGRMTCLPGRLGKRILVFGYRFGRKKLLKF